MADLNAGHRARVMDRFRIVGKSAHKGGVIIRIVDVVHPELMFPAGVHVVHGDFTKGNLCTAAPRLSQVLQNMIAGHAAIVFNLRRRHRAGKDSVFICNAPDCQRRKQMRIKIHKKLPPLMRLMAESVDS